MTVDELLSSDEVLTIAEADQKKSVRRFHELLFGLLDICMALLLFLPFFAGREGETIREVSLLLLDEIHPVMRIAYFAVVVGMSVWGILALALQNFEKSVWKKWQTAISLGLGAFAVLLFVMSLQPYAAVFAFVLLAIKGIVLIKKQ